MIERGQVSTFLASFDFLCHHVHAFLMTSLQITSIPEAFLPNWKLQKSGHFHVALDIRATYGLVLTSLHHKCNPMGFGVVQN